MIVLQDTDSGSKWDTINMGSACKVPFLTMQSMQGLIWDSWYICEVSVWVIQLHYVPWFFSQQQTSYRVSYLPCLLNNIFACRLIGLNGPLQWIHSLLISVLECGFMRCGIFGVISQRTGPGKVYSSLQVLPTFPQSTLPWLKHLAFTFLFCQLLWSLHPVGKVLNL